MKTFKNLFSVTAIVALLGTMLSPAVNYVDASYSNELEGAYEFAADNGITSASSIDNANMYGSLTRVAMAKMMANFSMDVLGNEADTDMECTFPDVSDALDAQYDMGVTNACQLGLMGVGIDNFNPYGLVTRAEFGTVLSRALYGDMYNGANPYYADHLDALKDAGIMNNISNPMQLEVRGYVMLMMERAADEETTTEGCSAEELLACITADDYDDCIADCSGDVEDEDEPSYDLDGELTVELDNNTPDSMKLPIGAQGVEVAVWEVEAEGEDIDLFTATIERSGMGASSAVKDVALFTEDGRVSKAKSFNSDDVATVTFSPALTIKAGEKVELMAIVSTNVAPTASVGQEFALSLTDLDTSAEDIDADYPLTAETMEIGAATAKSITISPDGSVSDVKVGEEEAEVLKFEIKNNSSSNEDVELSSITLRESGTIDEEDEMSNFVLWYDGEEVATANNADGKYVTFNLDDTVLIEDGKTEKFVVTADIDGGAAKFIQFYLDKELDLMATASKYGFVSITNNLDTDTNNDGSIDTLDDNYVDVDAGELSIVTTEPEITKVRKDKDDLVVGEMKFVANAGKDLELDDFTVVFEVDTIPTAGAGTDELLDILENVELYNASAGGIYDLSCTETSAGVGIAATDKIICTDTDMDIALRDGSTNFEIRYDTQNVTTVPAGLKFYATVNVGTNVKVYETEDDTRVTDITPSSITFKTIEVQNSTASVTSLTLSSAKSAVIGSEDVVSHKFEVEAGESSDIEIDEIKVKGTIGDNGTAGNATFDNTRVNSVKLYEDSVEAGNLLDEVSGSQIASNVATFNGFKVNVDKEEKKTFYVTVDIINDANQAADTILLDVTAISAEDSDNDDITVNEGGVALAVGNPATSTRTLTIKGVGTLAVVADNTDSETDKAKNILAGTESDFVASYEFTATNEGVLIKDMKLDETSVGALKNAVSEVILYANDKTTEIARESVSSDTVTFDNIDYTIAEGNENVYVKVITNTIGKDEAGTQTTDLDFALTVTDAEGADSNKVVVNPGVTADSKAFSVVPVKISSIAFVDSYGGETVTSNLTNGENVVGIIAVTADASDNTNTTNGSSLKTELESMKVSISTDLLEFDATVPDAGDVSSLTVEKINGTVTAKEVAKVDGTAMADAYDLNGGINLFKGVDLWADEDLDNGTTAYYVVKATVSGLSATANKYIQLKLSDLDTAATATVEYSSDNVADPSNADEGSDDITSLRIGVTSLNADSISSSY